MTIDNAMSISIEDKLFLQRMTSDLETAYSLYAVQEGEKAIELYASIRLEIRRRFSHWPFVHESGSVQMKRATDSSDEYRRIVARP